MKQMIRSQSDDFSHFEYKPAVKSQIFCPSPQKKNISLECKLKINLTNGKANSPDQSSKMSSFTSIDELENRSPMKLIKSCSTMERFVNSDILKKIEVDMELAKNIRKNSMNPHEKNFVENKNLIEFDEKTSAKIFEAESQEEEEEEDLNCDFERFYCDIEK